MDTTHLTLDSILTLSPAEAESTYRALRDHMQERLAEVASLRRSVQASTMVGRSVHVSHEREQADEMAAEYERLTDVKSALAVLTGRYDDRLAHLDARLSVAVARRRALLDAIAHPA